MKLSIYQSAKIYEALGAIEAAKKADGEAAIVCAFAKLALIADDIVCAGFLGRFRKRPSSMGVFEFLVFLQDEFPKYTRGLAEESSLIEKLKLVTITPK